MRLAAVIVSHNQPRLALSCVRSLAGAVGREATVIVVNDARAVTPEIARELLACAAHVVVNDAFMGYGANLNHGVSALDGDYEAVLLLNDDVEFRPGALDALDAALAADASIGLVGPALIGGDGLPQLAVFRFP